METEKKQSILARPGDTTLYRVWVNCSTIRLHWDEMTTMQKLKQIGYEEREARRAACVEEVHGFSTEEQRHRAPLSSNKGFSLLR